MPLTVYSIDQSQEWDAVVRSFSSYDVYYLSGYVKGFRIHGDGEPLLIYFENIDIRGINVVMKRDISKDTRFTGRIEENIWFDFITPYGYGGWIIEGDGDKEVLFDTYEKWCKGNNVVSEFVRYHPVLENQAHSNLAYDVLALGRTISIDLSSPETIWANLTSKNRNMIRKAQKERIVIYNGRYPEIFNQFRTVYNGTMDKDEADSYYYFKPEFYDSILNDLSAEAQVFYAKLDDKVIAASIILAANGRLNYHLSGAVKEYQSLAPTNLLLYNVALWGYANGCKTLHLGGGVGGREDGLFKFKRSFYRGEDLNRFYIGRKIFIKEKYDEFVDMRDNLPESGFFPIYRT